MYTPPPPQGVNHVAFFTSDLPTTHKFFTEILRCKFAGSIRNDARVLSNGDVAPPFLHVFYQTQRGDCIAFFDVDGEWERHDEGIPPFTRHLAMSVADEQELLAWQQHLRDNGVEVSDVLDHEGIWRSIYFFDPNGYRLELTYQTRPLDRADAVEAEEALEAWFTRA